jgi:hypothetical protein
MFMEIVVFPHPPFWFATAITMAIWEQYATHTAANTIDVQQTYSKRPCNLLYIFGYFKRVCMLSFRCIPAVRKTYRRCISASIWCCSQSRAFCYRPPQRRKLYGLCMCVICLLRLYVSCISTIPLLVAVGAIRTISSVLVLYSFCTARTMISGFGVRTIAQKRAGRCWPSLHSKAVARRAVLAATVLDSQRYYPASPVVE